MKSVIRLLCGLIFFTFSTSIMAWRIELPGGGEWKGDDPKIPLPQVPTVEKVLNDPVKLLVNPVGFIDSSGIPQPGDFVEYVIKNPDKLIELVNNPGNIPYLPVATGIISGRNAVISGGGKPIPENIKPFLRQWYSDALINSVRWTSNWTAINNSLQAAQMSFNGSTQAIALINAVVFRNESLAQNKALWAHEMYHVQQYEDWGVFGFAKRWVDNSSPTGPVESPAYDRENEAAQILNASNGRNARSSGRSGTTQPVMAPPVQNGYGPGTQMSPCGCNGFVNGFEQVSAPACSSGIARPLPCYGTCMAGGQPWAMACQ